MTGLSKVKYPYLNELELNALTPEQARVLNGFTEQQYRRDKKYEESTVPVKRTVLEDRTPNGSIDSHVKARARLKKHAVVQGWTVRQYKLALLRDAGYTQVECAARLRVSRQTVNDWLNVMRGRGKETAPPR